MSAVVGGLIFDCYDQYETILKPPAELNEPPAKLYKRNVKIEDYTDEEIPLYFRFQNKEQLYKLLEGFQFPTQIKPNSKGHKFSPQEVLLVSLFRLSFPTTLTIARLLFGMEYSRVSRIFTWFIDFMVTEWGYFDIFPFLSNR